jgi:hypothetical protein
MRGGHRSIRQLGPGILVAATPFSEVRADALNSVTNLGPV